MHRDPAIRRISNFAPAPFVLEGFWQSLRPTTAFERKRIAALSGGAARKAGQEMALPPTVRYRKQIIAWGSPEHWDLMRVACRAKFTQVPEARDALLATSPRPLEHRMRRDSKSIPGVIMAGIWMHLREELALKKQEG